MHARAVPRAATDLGTTRLTANVAADVHLAATDGWASMPPAAPAISPFWPDPLGASHGTDLNLYVFGFRNVTGLSDAQVTSARGQAQISAPQLAFDEGKDYRVKLSNLGLAQRPDLTDGHTIHWHGFVNAIPLFDGVPELSISVPIGRSFTYFYRPHDAGTYMYHCHFEDVEHVQMGMTGLLYVRPKQNAGVGAIPAGKYAYNDGDGSTRYDREFGFMLTEVFVEGHYRDAHIQTTDWTDFKASFWCLNGRSYPDTLAANAPVTSRGFDPLQESGRLKWQPNSSLVTANAGDRVLLRVGSLGYQNHAMTVDGIDLTIVGKDASLLKNGAVQHYITTNTIEVGPGESRDVLFTAPAFDAAQAQPADSHGPYNAYLLYDRNYTYDNNAGAASLGGMVTEIRVYPASTLSAQSVPNA
jgi:FtsP/CotA-like multicopper oxidase with cupredoxin domain